MTNTKSRRGAAHRVADFVEKQSGAKLDRVHLPTIHDNHLVVCGSLEELAKVQKWANDAGIECPIDAALPDDPEWSCARISLESAGRALLAAERVADTARARRVRS